MTSHCVSGNWIFTNKSFLVLLCAQAEDHCAADHQTFLSAKLSWFKPEWLEKFTVWAKFRNDAERMITGKAAISDKWLALGVWWFTDKCWWVKWEPRMNWRSFKTVAPVLSLCSVFLNWFPHHKGWQFILWSQTELRGENKWLVVFWGIFSNGNLWMNLEQRKSPEEFWVMETP